MEHKTVAMISVAITVAALAVIGAGSAGGAPRGSAGQWTGCSGHPRQVRHLQASRLTCAKAIKAIKRGKFALTPGGPLFSTRGFKCDSPVGPPVDGPRFTVCARHGHKFRFYSFAEPK
jgi:hypothetical protein